MIDLSRYDVIALDTETTGISFSDVPVGVSVAVEDQIAYYAWGHQGGGNNCTLDQVRTWLRQLNQQGVRIYMFNANFDLHMLQRIGVSLANAEVEDVGFMAALLNEHEPAYTLEYLSAKYLDQHKSDDGLNQWCAEHFGGPPTRKQAKNYWRAPATIVTPYAAMDASLTYQLAKRLRPRLDQYERIYKIETALIPILHKMHEVGVRVDRDAAQEKYDELGPVLDQKEREWTELTGGVPLRGNGSRKELWQLWEALDLPYGRTKKGNPSISKAILEGIDHPVGALLIEIRKLSKFREQFIKSYILDHVIDGRIHANFHPLRNDQYGTISGRFSSSDPNLQNPPSPSRDKINGSIFRGFFKPEEGALWTKLDYSQIEFRLFASDAGGRVAQAYIDNPRVDFHQWCADTVGLEGKEGRARAKNGNFAKLYGAGVGRLALTLGVTRAEAEAFLTLYNERLPEAANLYQRTQELAEARGWIKTIMGRRCTFRVKNRRYQMTHAALNRRLQGSAADIMKDAMVKVASIVDWDNVVLHLTVHDELDLSIPRGEEGRKWIAQAREIMQDYPMVKVPILVDAEIGEDWGHLEDLT